MLGIGEGIGDISISAHFCVFSIRIYAIIIIGQDGFTYLLGTYKFEKTDIEVSILVAYKLILQVLGGEKQGDGVVCSSILEIFLAVVWVDYSIGTTIHGSGTIPTFGLDFGKGTTCVVNRSLSIESVGDD
jgi:hypothetical protein